jgi:hypothetical protein
MPMVVSAEVANGPSASALSSRSGADMIMRKIAAPSLQGDATRPFGAVSFAKTA